MYRTIMVAHSGDSQGRDALALARLFAQAASVERVVIAHVVHESESHVDELHAALERALPGFRAGVETAVHVVPADSAADALRAVAAGADADLLITGSTHRGRFGRMFIGTTAQHLIDASACPVSVAPRDFASAAGDVRTIGVAFDGLPASHHALAWAVELAGALSAGLRLVAVVDTPPLVADQWSVGPGMVDLEVTDEVRDVMQQRLDETLAGLTGVRAEGEVQIGDVVAELRDAARRDLDLLVVGSKPHSSRAGTMLGSVSAALARSCPAPFVAVPAAAEASVMAAHDELPAS